MNVVGMSVRELGEHIRRREISPVEVAETFLERGERIGSKLNAYATLTRERALAEAREAEKEIAAGKYRGPLHGIPYAAKNLLAAKGYPTTRGARPYANQRFDFDAAGGKGPPQGGAGARGKKGEVEAA